jgi:hypothetical protein
MFVQGGLCFFCEQPLAQGDASVEHLVASANGGGNGDDNCVVCCKALNALFGSMSLKDKIRAVLRQKGTFKCPNAPGARKAKVSEAVLRPATPQTSIPLSEKLARVIADLKKRGAARPATIKKLSSTIGSLFQKQISQEEIASLIESLRRDGKIVVSGEKVSYELPSKVA